MFLIDHREISQQKQFHEIESKSEDNRRLSIECLPDSKGLSISGKSIGLRREINLIYLLEPLRMILEHRLQRSQLKHSRTQKVGVANTESIDLPILRIDLMPHEQYNLHFLSKQSHSFFLAKHPAFLPSQTNLVLEIMRGVFEHKEVEPDIRAE